MPKRIPLFSLLFLLGLGSVQAPVSAQALVPYTLRLDSQELEQQGLSLVQDAAGLARFQQYELALPRAHLATQLAPKRFQTWFLLGSLYLQKSELDKGIAALQKAQSLEPNEAAIRFSLGSAYFQKGQYETAVSNLVAGLKLKPDVPEALFDLGNAYYKLGRFPDALAQYQKAVAKDKKFWPAINNIGLVKYETGDVEGAIRQWRSALALDSKAAEPHLALAVALYTKGDTEQGLKMGETAIQLDSRYADLKFLKENLWGDRLLSATKKFLEIPRIQASIVNAQTQPSPSQTAPE